mmetsp:Transcript_21506/g.26490  ORF Transcript_21506/g.26490 Transcript_21506/m.26490 type:complete len:84 (+) Transcript_21506:121-372(+)
MADEEPVDIRHEIWDDVRQNKCQYWNNKYEDCKVRFKTTTDEEASCKAWYMDLWSCIAKNGADRVFGQIMKKNKVGQPVYGHH